MPKRDTSSCVFWFCSCIGRLFHTTWYRAGLDTCAHMGVWKTDRQTKYVETESATQKTTETSSIISCHQQTQTYMYLVVFVCLKAMFISKLYRTDNHLRNTAVDWRCRDNGLSRQEVTVRERRRSVVMGRRREKQGGWVVGGFRFSAFSLLGCVMSVNMQVCEVAHERRSVGRPMTYTKMSWKCFLSFRAVLLTFRNGFWKYVH